MRIVLSFLKPYRRPLLIAILLMLVELAVELWHPLLVARIINDGIRHNDLSAVLQWGGWMAALALLAFVSGIINSFFAAHVSQNFGFDLRKKLFEKIQSFSFANFNVFPTSTLITRVTSDVTQLQNVIFMGMRIMLRAPLLIIGALVMALAVNVKLGLVLLAATPVLLVLLVLVMNKGFALFRSVQERLDQLNGVLRENLLGMRLIKAFVRDRYEVERFTEANEELRDRTTSALRLVELTIPMLVFLMNVCVLFILWFGSWEVQVAGANAGEVAAIVIYATRITSAMSIVSMILMNVSRAKASAQRVADVLDSGSDVVDADNADTTFTIQHGAVEFDNVTFQYPGTSRPVLQSISFRIQPGETVAILGATGSGKSTLFQLIPRLYDVSGGRIMIDNKDITGIQLETLRRQIGFVPQEAMLFSGTVMENILWGKDEASMEEVIAAAQSAQIHETIMKLPMQYETVLGQKGVNLSGGQKQRLSIARALIRKAKLLLLDDSTSALDVNTEARLLAALKHYRCTILLITQKISTAMQADQIILLDGGKVLAQGSHAELLDRCELYQRIVQSQLGEEVLRHG